MPGGLCLSLQSSIRGDHAPSVGAAPSIEEIHLKWVVFGKTPTLLSGSSASQDVPTPHMKTVPVSTSGDSNSMLGLSSHLVLVATSEQGSVNLGEAFADHDDQLIFNPLHGKVVAPDEMLGSFTDGLTREPDHPHIS